MRWGWIACVGVLAPACIGPGPISSSGATTSDESGIAASDESDGSDDGSNDGSNDSSSDSTGDDPTDSGSGGGPSVCDFGPAPGETVIETEFDVLIIVDNGPSMAGEQAKLAAAMPALVERFTALYDPLGHPLNPDVHVMVTSTDLGHPLCTANQTPGYEPKQGAPEQLPCLDRLADFNDVPGLCTSACPVAVAPVDPFVHFEGYQGAITNVPGSQVVEALRCLVPQGVNGCEYGSPLEAMVRALDPAATWNLGARPFARPDASLVVVMVSDRDDCSVRQPEGHAYFTDPALDTHWAVDPETGTKSHATPAVCWNAGVSCDALDGDGVYADCSASDGGEVLHPVQRYTELLESQAQLRQRPTFMLELAGVPSVTAHSDILPHEATAGGVAELEYHVWRDGSVPAGDLLPGDPNSAAGNQFEYGIGPGCTAEPEPGVYTDQALPPARIRELCDSLEAGGDPRCCIESACDADYDGALACILGAVQFAVEDSG